MKETCLLNLGLKVITFRMVVFITFNVENVLHLRLLLHLGLIFTTFRMVITFSVAITFSGGTDAWKKLHL